MEERQIMTGIDRFLEMVRSAKEGLRSSDAAKKLGVPEATIEIWAEILRQDGLIEIKYDGFGKMTLIPMVLSKEPKETPVAKQESKATPAAKPESIARAPEKIAVEQVRAPAAKHIQKKSAGLKTKKRKVLLKKYSIINHPASPVQGAATSKDNVFSKASRMFWNLFRGKERVQVPASPQQDEKTDDILKRLDRIKKMGK